MKERDHLESYLQLCKRVFERMEEEGSWPWRDSTLAEDLVDSEDTEPRV